MINTQTASGLELALLEQEEQQRFLAVYQAWEARQRAIGQFFDYHSFAHAYQIYERYLETLRLLKGAGYHPLTDVRIADVGCGDGNMLRQFLQWGAKPEHLAGIDLRPAPIAKALALNPNLDVRCGPATRLPWPDASFDLVCQHTVFTSVLDPAIKHRIAAEMARLVRPGGAILWYDFLYDNPRNSDVRGIRRREIRSLFPGFELILRRITLAHFIARRLPESLLPLVYPLLSAVRPLRTHYLGLLRRAGGGSP